MTNTIEMFYDEEADFLELFFGEPEVAIAEELEPEVFIRRVAGTGEIKSIGVFGFKKQPGILDRVLKRLHLILPIRFAAT